MEPIVSVIVPTFRRNLAFKNALLSLCTQACAAMEIIIIDDNADQKWNESVAQIVDEARTLLQEQHSIQLLVNAENIGAAGSRNKGIAAARGEYITFLDDDDIYLPDKIKTQLESMQAVCADYSLMDLDLLTEDGRLVENKRHPYLKGIQDRQKLVQLHLKHHLTGTDAMMFRKDYLMKVGCFGSIDIGDEFYLMMNAIENNGRFHYIPLSMVHATVHYDGSGLSGGPLKVQGENLLFKFKKRYFSQLETKDVRYIRMRHYAVLAFAHLKAKRYTFFIKEALCSFFASPAGCIRLLSQRRKTFQN